MRKDREKIIERYIAVASKLDLDPALADQHPTVAVAEIFSAVHALPPDVIAENFSAVKGAKLSGIYKRVGRLDTAEKAYREDNPFPKTRAANTSTKEEPKVLEVG